MATFELSDGTREIIVCHVPSGSLDSEIEWTVTCMHRNYLESVDDVVQDINMELMEMAGAGLGAATG